MNHPRGFGPLLGHCAHLAKERMDARLSGFDVTPAQMHTLLYLHHHDGRALQCEITGHLRVKPSTAAGILDRLEEKGLVERSVSGDDARRRLITLTEKGCQQREQLRQIHQEAETLMLQGFSPEETEQLRSLLERLRKNLEEDRTV